MRPRKKTRREEEEEEEEEKEEEEEQGQGGKEEEEEEEEEEGGIDWRRRMTDADWRASAVEEAREARIEAAYAALVKGLGDTLSDRWKRKLKEEAQAIENLRAHVYYLRWVFFLVHFFFSSFFFPSFFPLLFTDSLSSPGPHNRIRRRREAWSQMESLLKATEDLAEMHRQAKDEADAASLKSMEGRVKQLEASEEAWKKERRGHYARAATDLIEAEITRLQKEKEDEVNTMRERYESRVPERARREEDQIQKELRVRGNEVEELKGKMEVVESHLEDEADKVKELEGEVVRLAGVKEEVLSLKGKALNQVKELAKAKAELTKLQQAKEKAKEKKAKCKERKEGGEVDGEGAQHGNSSSTMYRRAQDLEEILLTMARDMPPGSFGGVWVVLMKKASIKGLFTTHFIKPWANDEAKREREMLDRIAGLIAHAKANHKREHWRVVYEVLGTAFADTRAKEDGGCFRWVMQRMGFGIIAMRSGMGRMQVLEASCFLDGIVFKDDRAVFQTKNEQHPVAAQLQMYCWVEIFCRASPNSDDDCFIHLPSAEEQHRPTHVFVLKEGGRLEKERQCIGGYEDLTGVLQMKTLVERQFALQGKKCMKVRVRHKGVSDECAFDAFLKGDERKQHLEEYPADACLFTYSWFLHHKPPQCKSPPRNTSQCTYCEQATMLGFAAVKAHKVRPLPAPLGETATNASASPEERPSTDYRLHDHCGTDHFNACRCSHCIGGLCREKQPFRGDSKDGKSLLKEMGAAYMCVKDVKDGETVRLWKCINGTCVACKDGVFLEGCPLQYGPQAVAWTENVWREVITGKSGPGGAVEEGDKTKVLQLEKRQGTIADLMKKLQKETGSFTRHWHVYRKQQGAYHRMGKKETMVPGVLYIIMDFAMNYSHDHLIEVQSAFFAKDQTTILPVVVWFLAPGPDGKGEVQQHSRVYSSADRHHTNNFVQVVLDDALAYFKGVMEKAAEGSVDFFMKRMCLWSDGCAAQFKNRWQMNKLVKLLHDTHFGLVGAEHHFFASCHGKGPCDGLGGWVKTFLRWMEMQNGVYLGTSEEVHKLLKEMKEYTDREEYAQKTGTDLKCQSRTFMYVKLVGVEKDQVTELQGIKSMHCFVATTDGCIRMFPTSCTCLHCLAMEYDTCIKVASGERGEGREVLLYTFTPPSQASRTEYCNFLDHGKKELLTCEVGDWMLMRVLDEERKVYAAPQSGNWDCEGAFRLAQLAVVPETPHEDGRRRGRGRGRKGDGTDILVFYADETIKEKEWFFKSEEVCYQQGGEMAKRWNECHAESGGCDKMHTWPAKVENVLMKIETREEGQQRYTLTEDAETKLAELQEMMYMNTA